MRILLALTALLILAGCGTTPYVPSPSPCGTDPGGRDCQIERYLNTQ
ncbi:hypothetical protein [Variovorax sp. PBL-E5]|nr:hypothetical protein [Variovorax sp. PBL-E5]VTU32910.1 hypothetical protein E5CHR_03511 [Variovorax sp. PBL-E5]